MKLFKTSRGNSALTLVDVVLSVAVIVFIMFVFLPAFLPRRRGAVGINCISNLKQVDLAFRLWSGDNNDRYPMKYYTNEVGQALFLNAANSFLYFQVMSNELSNLKVLVCPADLKRSAATNFATDFNGTHLSYFVGMDASEEKPQSFLAGDSNITNAKTNNNGLMELTTNQIVTWTSERHTGGGNIAMADGSVQQFSTSALRLALQKTGFATNRLLMPPASQ